MFDWFHWLNLAGVAVCAISGTLMAYQKRMDGFGVVVLASATAIGGGTLRDVMLDVPVFWIADTDYLYTTLIAAFVPIIWLRISPRFPFHYLLIADAFGLALFNVVGIEKALANDTGMAVAVPGPWHRVHLCTYVRCEWSLKNVPVRLWTGAVASDMENAGSVAP